MSHSVNQCIIGLFPISRNALISAPDTAITGPRYWMRKLKWETAIDREFKNTEGLWESGSPFPGGQGDVGTEQSCTYWVSGLLWPVLPSPGHSSSSAWGSPHPTQWRFRCVLNGWPDGQWLFSLPGFPLRLGVRGTTRAVSPRALY